MSIRGALVALLALGAVAAEELTLEELARRGAETVRRLEQEPAILRTRVPGRRETTIECVVWSAPPDFRLDLFLTRRGQEPARFISLVQLDARWHVREGGGIQGVWRPYEAPFTLGSAYRYLEEAWPKAYARQGGDRLEGTRGELAFVRREVSGARRTQLEGALDSLREVRARTEPGPESERLQARITELADVLEQGIPLVLEAASGTWTTTGREGFPVKHFPVEWRGDAPPKVQAPAGLPDRTQPLGPNLLMIGHDSRWRPADGSERAVFDGHLLDLDSLELRRIPYRGAEVSPGCFVDERRAVVVLGHARERTLTRLNLADGSSHRLGGDAFLPTGQLACPALSPDGDRLAVLYAGEREALLSFRLHLVDLADGTTQAIGEPFDGHGLSWLPDGEGLIAVRRTPGEGGEAVATIVRLGLDGSVRELRGGDFAQVCGAAGAERILFERADGLFCTCDLTGGDEQLLGDGLADHGFPAVAPDGVRAVFMRFDPSTGPRPVVVDLADGSATPLEVGPGCWGMPAWR